MQRDKKSRICEIDNIQQSENILEKECTKATKRKRPRIESSGDETGMSTGN